MCVREREGHWGVWNEEGRGEAVLESWEKGEIGGAVDDVVRRVRHQKS